MKVLITGSDGYIGTLLAHILLQRGYHVVGLDTGYYREGKLYEGVEKPSRIIDKDIRQITEVDLQGFDAVVHLAELANDPLGDHHPQVTYSINYQASVALAYKCKQVGIPRFVYTSSCSVYGQGRDELMLEDAEVNPLTIYAQCKTLVERDLMALVDKDFFPTILRNATVYGISPHMRFDLVLNNLAGLAWTTHEIKMITDGTPWRPLVHVRDVCEAIACVLQASPDTIGGQIFNIGRTDENYRIRDIAHFVAEAFPNCVVKFGTTYTDHRSYRVSFEKIRRLPHFTCQWNIVKGIKELHDFFIEKRLSREVFEFRAYTRLRQIDYLISTGRLNKELFWREY